MARGSQFPSLVRLVLVAWLGLMAACRPPGYGKHDGSGDGDGDVDAAVAVDTPAAADAPAAGCDKAFRLDGHGQAASVWLTGDFVAWAPDLPSGAIAFTLGPDGAWTGDHRFQTGTYQYKFIVDSATYIADPTNTDTVDDGFGGKNSVLRCPP